MTLAFYEATKPYMMPNGGMMDTGEITSLDPVNPANAVAIASGVLVSSGAPSAPSAAAVQRVQMKAAVTVNGVLYNVNEIATFAAATSAQLIAANQAVTN